MIRRITLANRRGIAMVEAAVVYPVTLLLLMGLLVLGIGVFRYDQLQFLAREGARYASVHGPTYVAEANAASPAPSPPAALATSSTVMSNAVTPLAVGLPGLSCTLTWNPNPPTTTTPSTVTVTLSYTWVPEGLFKTGVTMTASSTMPVVY